MLLQLDVRSKILFLIVTNLLMFKKLDTNEHFFIASLFTLCIILFFNIQRAVRIYSIYLFFTIYEVYFMKLVTLPILDNFLLFTALMFKTIYFPICAGIVLVGSSKVSEFITFLRQIKLPKNIIIVLAVIFRFFPTMLTDYKFIKNSLAMKGIGASPFYYIKHPFRFMEYVFVPYVIVSTNIANELSISCLCRGIDHHNNATSIQKLEFKLLDYLFMMTLVIGTVLVFKFL